MLEIILVIVKAVWLMLPAYISNPSAVVFGGGTPIDLGKTWTDGKRILGDGKTIRGLAVGTACGIIIGAVQIFSSPAIDFVPPHTPVAVIMLSLGALLGDIIKSFFKRRFGFSRGAQLLLVDQLDFVAGAWLFTYIFDPVWFTSNFSIPIIITILILTPVLHRLTNIFGYYMKIKKEPW